MDQKFIDKYAKLLTTYCCNIKAGDKVFIRSTYLAEALILECQKEILKKGGHCEISISLPGMAKQYYEYSEASQLEQPPELYGHAVRKFDVIITIQAPFDIFELQDVDEKKLAISQAAIRPIKQKMMKRSSQGDLRWVLCNYPTKSLAKAAKMTLKKYTEFITNACFLNKKNPQKAWEDLSNQQEQWVNKLNQGKKIQFISEDTNISFKLDQRIWINSDGKRNMPSGEVFTSPIESSAEGMITFTIPSLVFGQVINKLVLTLEKGKVVKWESQTGQALLDRLFSIDGANMVGEIAIGTNHQIQDYTLNTLFDEKIGGTIHMAIGASYPETGGKNMSSIHHDFVTNFTSQSHIYLDDNEIYRNGKFIV